MSAKPFDKPPAASPFPRRPPTHGGTHVSDDAARRQRLVCQGYADACAVPLAMVRDPAEPKGYRWADAEPNAEAGSRNASGEWRKPASERIA